MPRIYELSCLLASILIHILAGRQAQDAPQDAFEESVRRFFLAEIRAIQDVHFAKFPSETPVSYSLTGLNGQDLSFFGLWKPVWPAITGVE
jgi:hypothetical protein